MLDLSLGNLMEVKRWLTEEISPRCRGRLHPSVSLYRLIGDVDRAIDHEGRRMAGELDGAGTVEYPEDYGAPSEG